jgi:ADP-ribose pyrophosphatase YjhB (NUDIX family)
MYKVFILNRPVVFASSPPEIATTEQSFLTLKYEDNSDIEILYEVLNTDRKLDGIIFLSNKPKKAWKAFLKAHRIIDASGGIVINPKGQILFIFRKNHWDLPKGKIDKGEGIKKAAKREVEEECGISGLKIQQPLPITYHTYKDREKRTIKRTYWFEMSHPGTDDLTPQIEEDITEVRWMGQQEYESVKGLAYPSIRDLVEPVFESLFTSA